MQLDRGRQTFSSELQGAVRAKAAPGAGFLCRLGAVVTVKDCSVAAGNAIRIMHTLRPCGLVVCYNDMSVLHIRPRSCKKHACCCLSTIAMHTDLADLHQIQDWHTATRSPEGSFHIIARLGGQLGPFESLQIPSRRSLRTSCMGDTKCQLAKGGSSFGRSTVLLNR